MLKFTYDDDTTIPDPLKEFYTKADDGKFYLQAEGAVPKTKLDEFRNTNITLAKERDDLKTRFTGVDPDEYKTLKERKELLDQGKLIQADGLEAAVKQRVAKMNEEHTATLSKIEQRAAQAEAKIAEYMIDGELIKAGTELGLKKTAAQDLILRGRQVFTMKDGKLVATGQDGQPAFGPTGEYQTPREYVQGLLKTASHLFDENSGGGAGSGAGSGAGTSDGNNPWRANSWNMTKQAQMMRDNPTQAAKLKAQAVAAGEGKGPRKQ